MTDNAATKPVLTPAEQFIIDKAPLGGRLSDEDFEIYKQLKAAEAGFTNTPFSSNDLDDALKFLNLGTEPK